MSNRTILALKIIGICVALVALTWIVFGQTLGHQFVNFDDGAYVRRNSEVTHGITIHGIEWAFTHPVAANWHPLTILSHMLDCQIYGVVPAAHHFTNVLLHSIATILLFLIFWGMTRGLWQSAFIAAVFAVHPLHVESVAWIAERKDVLSAVFFLLTIAAYVFYALWPSVLRYLLMSILFACGLMAKPMLVTLPFVLLLLDYWPLRRFDHLNTAGPAPAIRDVQKRSGKWLVLEKIPLFILSVAASAAAIVTQERSINLIRQMSLASRIENSFVSLLIYLRQTVWPRNLAAFYPYPESGVSTWEVILAISVFASITTAAFVLRNDKPYILTGWLWFAGMLIPVIGIVQVGIQAHADRYNYLPQIGLSLIVAWAITEISAGWRYQRVILTLASLIAVAALAWSARIQTWYWRDSQLLWEHAIAVTPENETEHEHLSDAYLDKGRIDDAISQAREAVQLLPDSADAHGVLGAALARTRQLDEALSHLQTALQLNPKLARAHYNLGNVFLQRGELDEAIASYEAELRLYPSLAEGHNNLASALFRKGRPNDAFEHLKTALELNPNYPEARNNFGIALSQRGEIREAIAQWNKTLQVQPDNLEAQCNLTWIFATFPDASIRNGARAVELGERAIKLSDGKNARIWRLAAAAYAEAGRFPDAIKAAQNARALAEAAGNAALVKTLESNIKLFEQNSPLRDLGAASSR